MSLPISDVWEFGQLLINSEPEPDFFVEDLNFVPAQKKATLVANADADGEALAREPNYSPSYIEWLVRVKPQGSTAATLAKAGELTDAVQACTKIFGGQPLAWTVHGTEKTYTGYALFGDIVEMPTTATGDQAGWLVDAPLFKVKLTCSSFWSRPRRVIKAATESPAEPLQILYVGGVLGDVPAQAALVLTDKAAQDRRFGAWGRDVVTSEANPGILINASELITAGYSGSLQTSAGAFSAGKAIRATVVGLPTVMFSTGRIAHVGSYAVYGRVKATSEKALFRISYRNGDGAMVSLEWHEATVVGGWSEIYLGEAFLDELDLGSQSSEIRVESLTTAAPAPSADSDFIFLWPTGKGAARARGVAAQTPTNLIAYDEAKTVGNLEGKEPTFPTGITWTEFNKTGANGFKVPVGGGYVERTAVSDASLNAGCFALLGTTAYGTFRSGVDVLVGTKMLEAQSRIGLLGRYVNTETYVVALLIRAGRAVYLQVLKLNAGGLTVLGLAPAGVGVEQAGKLTQTSSIILNIAADGTWSAQCGAVAVWGHDADLAAGGTLATGKVGLFDSYTSALAGTRYLKGFTLLGADLPIRVAYSGRKVQFDSDGCLRQDSTGVYDGGPSVYRGGDLYLEPAGELGLINRLAIRMRRNDNDAEEDSPVTDKHSSEVLVTERFLLPR